MPRTKKGEEIVHAQPGEISRIVKQSAAIASWPNINVDDAEEVAERITKYFNWCAENDIKPTVEGMALSVNGVRRQTLTKWQRENTHGKEVANVLKRAYAVLDECMAQLAVSGKINPVMAIFLMKNNHGYSDQQQVFLTPHNALGDTTPQNVLEERYMNSIVIDSEETENDAKQALEASDTHSNEK